MKEYIVVKTDPPAFYLIVPDSEYDPSMIHTKMRESTARALLDTNNELYTSVRVKAVA